MEGSDIGSCYQRLTPARGLAPGTAVRHFNVMHHMMEKAATIWSKETGIDRNPADEIEVKRPDDRRERYLSAEEIRRLKQALDEKMFRKGTRQINETFSRLRLLVLIALTTGMRIAEVFALEWRDVLYKEQLIAVPEDKAITPGVLRVRSDDPSERCLWQTALPTSVSWRSVFQPHGRHLWERRLLRSGERVGSRRNENGLARSDADEADGEVSLGTPDPSFLRWSSAAPAVVPRAVGTVKQKDSSETSGTQETNPAARKR